MDKRLARVPILTAARAREMLHYHKRTGILKWRSRSNSKVPAGSIAGHVNDRGYRVIRLDGERFRATRLIWLIVTGAWPHSLIDHKDGVRDNNRWRNLRLASSNQNAWNLRTASTFKGVSLHKGLWRARIFVCGKEEYLGSYEDPADAARQYDIAARLHFGEFAVLNFPAAGAYDPLFVVGGSA